MVMLFSLLIICIYYLLIPTHNINAFIGFLICSSFLSWPLLTLGFSFRSAFSRFGVLKNRNIHNKKYIGFYHQFVELKCTYFEFYVPNKANGFKWVLVWIFIENIFQFFLSHPLACLCSTSSDADFDDFGVDGHWLHDQPKGKHLQVHRLTRTLDCSFGVDLAQIVVGHHHSLLFHLLKGYKAC